MRPSGLILPQYQTRNGRLAYSLVPIQDPLLSIYKVTDDIHLFPFLPSFSTPTLGFNLYCFYASSLRFDSAKFCTSS